MSVKTLRETKENVCTCIRQVSTIQIMVLKKTNIQVHQTRVSGFSSFMSLHTYTHRLVDNSPWGFSGSILQHCTGDFTRLLVAVYNEKRQI